MLLLYQIFVFWVLCAQQHQYALAGSLLSLHFTLTPNQWLTYCWPCLDAPRIFQHGMGHSTLGRYIEWLAGTPVSNASPIITWNQNWLSLATCVQGPFLLSAKTLQCCLWRDKLNKSHLESIGERQVNAGCLSDLIMY